MIDRKFWARLLLFSFLFWVCIFNSPANADDGDRYADIIFSDGNSRDLVGTAVMRGKDIWVPAQVLRSIGVPLRNGPNGKGFLIDVKEPSKVFGINELERLAGPVIALYFPSMADSEGTSYLNVKGLEQFTGISAKEINAGLELKKNNFKIPFNNNYKKPDQDFFKNKRIALAWAHITRDNPDLETEDRIDALDVISPTWFNLTDGSGGMANRASASYVEAVRKKGYRIWPLVSNGFSKENTSRFFNDTAAVNLFIARLLCYSKLYGFDGINIDFENLDVADRDKYVRFVSLLSGYLKGQGLVSSVDVHVPGNSNLSRSHDRAALSKHVDYIMLMAYDEHWRTSPRAGSVASMPWVERAVQKTIEEGVPPAKLILGVPFYMRKWEETPLSHGKVKVKGSTLTMSESDSIISQMGLSPVWLSDKGQYFYSYLSNGKTYKVWVENRDSIKAKLSILDKYRLAGVAGWRKGHETPDIWDVIRSAAGKR
ncbi:MAG: glycosyl hydrolase family 18 protein [Synergistaceae bacterium]|nr:glycosyl hydrolase family 18 protein [Synergistaceae bacterium]